MNSTQKKKYSRCFISSEQADELTNGESPIAEGFFITLKNDDIAIVQNILVCGLGVGDEIRVRSGSEELGEHPNMFVDVVKRNCVVWYLKYSLIDYEQIPDKLPREASDFIRSLEQNNILFSSMMKGCACCSASCWYG
jgi:hypothetical protein